MKIQAVLFTFNLFHDIIYSLETLVFWEGCIIMNNDKRFEGLWNATAEKRYNHFLTYTVDCESAWLLANEEGFATIDVDGYIHLLVWPSREFAEAYSKEDTPVEMDIHEFCERCEEMVNDENIRFMVFPTDKDAWIVSTEGLLNDLTEELGRVE